MKLPVFLTVAGSDSCGGAGIEVDIKTATVYGCYGMTCVTALTAQNTDGVTAVKITSRDQIKCTLEALFSDVSIDVIKTGMLTVDALEELCMAMEKYNFSGKLVVDPVLVATSGSILSEDSILHAIMTKLAPRTLVLTPNVTETHHILEYYGLNYKVDGLEGLKLAAKDITEKSGVMSTLVKGGHLPGDTTYDVLYDGGFTVFEHEHLNTKSTHGSGCTLSSAIASNLALGKNLTDAVEAALDFVNTGIVRAPQQFSKGRSGPLNHVFDIVPPASAYYSQYLTGASFYHHVISHPLVASHWEKFTNHEFVKQVADGSLPKKNWAYYKAQGYFYLETYAKVYAHSIIKAPTVEIAQQEAINLSEIYKCADINMEILRQMGVDMSKATQGPACESYCNFLLETAENGDWYDISFATSPCWQGYGEAANRFSLSSSNTNEQYKAFISMYASPAYNADRQRNCNLLSTIAAQVPANRLSKLIELFGKACNLEYKYWDDALEYDGPDLCNKSASNV